MWKPSSESSDSFSEDENSKTLMSDLIGQGIIIIIIVIVIIIIIIIIIISTKTASDCIFKLTRVNRIKHLLDQSTLMYLINAFVFCKLFYCSTVWSNTSTENIRKLQLVQNYACRIVTGLKEHDHISEALKSLKWLNVTEKLLFNDLVMVYKCTNNLTADYLHQRFQHRSEIHQSDTRQKSDFLLPKCRLATGQRASAFRGAKIFNSLPKFIRDTESLSSFKKRIFENIFNS